MAENRSNPTFWSKHLGAAYDAVSMETVLAAPEGLTTIFTHEFKVDGEAKATTLKFELEVTNGLRMFQATFDSPTVFRPVVRMAKAVDKKFALIVVICMLEMIMMIHKEDYVLKLGEDAGRMNSDELRRKHVHEMYA